MYEPKTKEQLFKTHGERLLNELNESCNSWLVHSPGRKVLDKVAMDAGIYLPLKLKINMMFFNISV